MKMTFIGTGAAFTINGNFHSNVLVESDSGRRMLIDCGSDARHALAKLGLGYLDINDVYISHLHADHAGGLEWLAFTTKFDPRCERPRLFIPENLLGMIWENHLKGSLDPIENVETNLETYFDAVPVKTSFTWEGTEFRVIPTKHIHGGEDWWPSNGLFFKAGSKKVFFTTDTQFFPDYYKKEFAEADVIFHDCETSKKPSGVHAHYDQLKTLPPELKKKMWLYHYNDADLPDAKADGFAGFVAKGQTFNF